MIRIPETLSGLQQVRLYDMSGKLTLLQEMELPGEQWILPAT